MATKIDTGHQQQMPVGSAVVIASQYVPPGLRHIYVDLIGAGVDCDLDLPHVSAAAGGLYTIYARTLENARVVNIYPYDEEVGRIYLIEGATYNNSITLTADEDYLQLFSTGREWIITGKKVT